MSDQKINCKPCMQDKHDECLNPKTCLCAGNKHGNSLRNEVKVDESKSIDPKFYTEWSEVNQVSFDGDDKIDNVALVLQKN